MIGEILREVAEAFREAVCQQAMTFGCMVQVIEHHGPPARFIIYDPETQLIIGFQIEDGQTVNVLRTHRLLVEPIDHVRLKPPDQMVRDWSIS